MKLEMIQKGSLLANLAILAIGWGLGVASMFLRSHLEKCREDRAAGYQAAILERQRQIEADLRTFIERSTILVRMNLAAYVRSGKWWSDEDDLRRFLTSLANGSYPHFVDPAIEGPWRQLVASSIELGNERLEGRTPADRDVQTYNLIRSKWEDAAKRSLGALPQTPAIAPSASAFEDIGALRPVRIVSE